MRKRFIRKIVGITIGVALLLASFTAGAVFAAKTDWLTFTGDAHIEESGDHVGEIMTILRQVNDDKLTAEDALAELEALNPPGLVKKIKALEGEVAELGEYISHLELEISRANGLVSEHHGKTQEALEEARGFKGGE